MKDPAYQTQTIAGPAAQFDQIASFYDELMAGVPYGQWVEYLEQLLIKLKCRPETVLDLCCGTGSVSLLLGKKGYSVSGSDVSPAMIEIARRKARDARTAIDFHVQDASELRLGRRFDLVISLFDSLNYILDSASLQQVFYRVFGHLNSGGLFIFDMNTELALAEGLFNQNNLGSRSPLLYDWRSSYDPAARLCTIHMTYVHRRGAAAKRLEVTHYQRAHDEEQIVEMLESAGLKVPAVYHAYSFRKATKRSDRLFFIARK
jgi:ubiquinone/menaquinone biosynthesis C-methylase UbiE